MNWRSIAPVDDETEWKWNHKAQKWIRTNDLSKLTYQFMMKQQKDQGNPKALEQNADQYQRQVHRVHIQNQEANAWIHQYYNNGSYYTTDTTRDQPYEKQLENMSDDQLRHSLLFWENQLHHLDKHNSKNKVDWNMDGDADKAHYAQNYGPNNPIYDMLHARLTPLIPNRDVNGKSKWNKIDWLGESYNNNLYNEESLKAKLRESTKHNYDYYGLLGQYKQSKNATAKAKSNFLAFAKNIPGGPGYILKNFFKYFGNSLGSQYYLDNSYTNHDNMRLAAVQNYMQQRHQQEINNSIRAQVANNTKNNLMSIFRKDKKDDTVVGVAEMQPQESNDMNMATQPVDAGMPQTNYAQTNQWQLTDQVEVYNRPLAFNPGKIDNAKQVSKYRQYNILRNWENNSIPLIMQGGFALWHMCLIQSLSKQPDATATDNGLTFQLTIQHVRLAKIVWGKQKAKGGISKGRNKRKSGKSKYTVRPGDNMWDIAKKQHCGWHALMKANPQIKNKNLIYPKQKLVIPK